MKHMIDIVKPLSEKPGQEWRYPPSKARPWTWREGSAPDGRRYQLHVLSMEGAFRRGKLLFSGKHHGGTLRLGLFTNGPRPRAYRIEDGSLRPWARAEDVLILLPSGKVRPGDLVLVDEDGRTRIRRARRRDADAPSRVLGRVVFLLRGVG